MYECEYCGERILKDDEYYQVKIYRIDGKQEIVKCCSKRCAEGAKNSSCNIHQEMIDEVNAFPIQKLNNKLDKLDVEIVINDVVFKIIKKENSIELKPITDVERLLDYSYGLNSNDGIEHLLKKLNEISITIKEIIKDNQI